MNETDVCTALTPRSCRKLDLLQKKVKYHASFQVNVLPKAKRETLIMPNILRLTNNEHLPAPYKVK